MVKKIQFVGPSFSQNQNLIGITWAGFRAYHQNKAKYPLAYEWLPPLQDAPKPFDQYVQNLDWNADVLCLSFLVWNHNLVRQIGETFRKYNPNGIIITGGPDVRYKEPEWVKNNLWIDAHVPYDGEVSITKILDSIHEGEDFRKNDGLILFQSDGNYIQTSPPDLMWDWDISPILENQEFFLEQIDRIKKEDGVAELIWETTRGCPYSCTFCDWGGGLQQKIRQKPMDMIYKELDFIMSSGIGLIHTTDANFGILKRDVDIVHYIRDNNHPTSGLRTFDYTAAKNQNERSIEIAKTLYEADLLYFHGIGLQDTNTDVLNAIKRKNISADKQMQLANSLSNHGIGVSVDWIFGMPEQTPDSVMEGYCNLFENNLHCRLSYNPCQILPNAEMGHPAYSKKFGLKTIDRPMYAVAKSKSILEKRDDGEYNDYTTSHGSYCIESNTFSTDDWITMAIEGDFVASLHGSGLTRHIAIFARNYLGMPYADFYKMVMREVFRNESPFKAEYNKLYGHFQEWTKNENENMAMEHSVPIENVERIFNRQIYHSFFIHKHKNKLFECINRYLKAKFPDNGKIIDDVMLYQWAITPDIDYDMDKGREIRCTYDWYAYFNSFYPGYTDIPELHKLPPNTYLKVNDTSFSGANRGKPLNWNITEDKEKRLEILFYRVCHYWRSERYFTNITYETLQKSEDEKSYYQTLIPWQRQPSQVQA